MFVKIATPLKIEGEAPRKYQDLNYKEVIRGFREIQGDCGILRFEGYEVNDGFTELVNPSMLTDYIESELDAYEKAFDILMQNFESVGFEAIS